MRSTKPCEAHHAFSADAQRHLGGRLVDLRDRAARPKEAERTERRKRGGERCGRGGGVRDEEGARSGMDEGGKWARAGGGGKADER